MLALSSIPTRFSGFKGERKSSGRKLQISPTGSPVALEAYICIICSFDLGHIAFDANLMAYFTL
jgi:hypothetical protein